MLRFIADILFPPSCYGCQGDCDSDSPLCWRCVSRLEPIGLVGPSELTAFDEDVAPIPVFCAWRFARDGPLSRLIHALKYDNRPWLGTALGRALAHRILRTSWPSTDIVMPIPLHRLRRLERGYNQSEWIARSVAGELAARIDHSILKRVGPTQTQTKLSREQRWENVRNAFAAKRTVDGSSVLLVDDVVTTGATVRAAASVLVNAGCSDVRAAAIALSTT